MPKGEGYLRRQGARRRFEATITESETGRFPAITETTDPLDFERRIIRDDTQIGLREGLDSAIKARNHFAHLMSLSTSDAMRLRYHIKMRKWADLQLRLEDRLRVIVRAKRAASTVRG